MDWKERTCTDLWRIPIGTEEVISKVSLKQLHAPCILYNLNGYYDDLKALLHHMVEKGLSSKERHDGIFFAENLDELERILERA